MLFNLRAHLGYVLGIGAEIDDGVDGRQGHCVELVLSQSLYDQ